MTNTALKSTGKGRPDTPLLCPTCSIDARSYKPNDDSYVATNHRADSECEDQMDQDFSLVHARDPKQLAIWNDPGA